MMQQGVRGVFEFDETAVGNKKSLPFGKLMQIHYGQVRFVASVDVATRTITFLISDVHTPWSPNYFRFTATASQDIEMILGWPDDGPPPQTHSQRLPGSGLWIPAGGALTLSVGSEQGADVWDVSLVVTYYSIPRP